MLLLLCLLSLCLCCSSTLGLSMLLCLLSLSVLFFHFGLVDAALSSLSLSSVPNVQRWSSPCIPPKTLSCPLPLPLLRRFSLLLCFCEVVLSSSLCFCDCSVRLCPSSAQALQVRMYSSAALFFFFLFSPSSSSSAMSVRGGVDFGPCLCCSSTLAC
uniref:Secreted protein n=1 Tax=Opuntia streptacantha TaxID=393608 RepID=A0A7C8YF05_OPUST